MGASDDLGTAGLFVVCDGVGGLSCGELASTTVVRTFGEWFERDFERCVTARDGGRAACGEKGGRAGEDSCGTRGEKPRRALGPVAEDWGRLLGRLNQRLAEYGRARGVQLGTTFTGLLVWNGGYLIGQVGDCRVYRVAGGVLERLTRDQTLASRAVAEGLLSDEEALWDRRSTVLLQAVGSQPGLLPAFSYGRARPEDLFVLCSDGFYRRLGDRAILEALAGAGRTKEALDAAVEGLIERAVEAGEKDDLTAVCVALAEDAGAADEPTSVLAGGAGTADEPTGVLAGGAGTADEPTGVLAGGDAP